MEFSYRRLYHKLFIKQQRSTHSAQGEGTIRANKLRNYILLISLTLAIILMSLSMTNRASALSETGIGIRMAGQLNAAFGETIEYQVTIIN
jgi:hypothetical protein